MDKRTSSTESGSSHFVLHKTKPEVDLISRETFPVKARKNDSESSYRTDDELSDDGTLTGSSARNSSEIEKINQMEPESGAVEPILVAPHGINTEKKVSTADKETQSDIHYSPRASYSDMKSEDMKDDNAYFLIGNLEQPTSETGTDTVKHSKTSDSLKSVKYSKQSDSLKSTPLKDSQDAVKYSKQSDSLKSTPLKDSLDAVKNSKISGSLKSAKYSKTSDSLKSAHTKDSQDPNLDELKAERLWDYTITPEYNSDEIQTESVPLTADNLSHSEKHVLINDITTDEGESEENLEKGHLISDSSDDEYHSAKNVKVHSTPKIHKNLVVLRVKSNINPDGTSSLSVIEIDGIDGVQVIQFDPMLLSGATPGVFEIYIKKEESPSGRPQISVQIGMVKIYPALDDSRSELSVKPVKHAEERRSELLDIIDDDKSAVSDGDTKSTQTAVSLKADTIDDLECDDSSPLEYESSQVPLVTRSSLENEELDIQSLLEKKEQDTKKSLESEEQDTKKSLESEKQDTKKSLESEELATRRSLEKEDLETRKSLENEEVELHGDALRNEIVTPILSHAISVIMDDLNLPRDVLNEADEIERKIRESDQLPIRTSQAKDVIVKARVKVEEEIRPIRQELLDLQHRVRDLNLPQFHFASPVQDYQHYYAMSKAIRPKQESQLYRKESIKHVDETLYMGSEKVDSLLEFYKSIGYIPTYQIPTPRNVATSLNLMYRLADLDTRLNCGCRKYPQSVPKCSCFQNVCNKCLVSAAGLKYQDPQTYSQTYSRINELNSILAGSNKAGRDKSLLIDKEIQRQPNTQPITTSATGLKQYLNEMQSGKTFPLRNVEKPETPKAIWTEPEDLLGEIIKRDINKVPPNRIRKLQ